MVSTTVQGVGGVEDRDRGCPPQAVGERTEDHARFALGDGLSRTLEPGGLRRKVKEHDSKHPQRGERGDYEELEQRRATFRPPSFQRGYGDAGKRRVSRTLSACAP